MSISGNNVWLGKPYQNDANGNLIDSNGSAFAYQLSDVLMDLDLDDLDDDSVSETDDNCSTDYNPDQSNYDGDLLGYACDLVNHELHVHQTSYTKNDNLIAENIVKGKNTLPVAYSLIFWNVE